MGPASTSTQARCTVVACDEACTNGQTCEGGVCQCSDDSLTLCGNQCVNLDSAADHCGTCGTACSDGLPCTDGECRCPDGETLCEGACVNIESEPLHCGDCGSACPEGETCVVGRCSGAVGDDCTSTLAHGISVTEIAVYQAGKVSIMKDGLALASDARDVDVVAGKNAMVRVFVGLEQGFANRVLSARLSLVEGEATRSNGCFTSAPSMRQPWKTASAPVSTSRSTAT